MAADQQLASFAPYVVSGWEYGTNCGYYVHRGTVYIVGGVEAGALSSVTDFVPGSGTLLTGLPPQLCPTVATSAPVFIDPNNSTSEYAGHAPYLAATIHPDGSWTLDGGNPLSFDLDTLLALVLSGAHWPTAAATPDTTTPHSLAPYMTDGYDAGTATFAIHDARLHLSGQVTVSNPHDFNTMFRFPVDMPVAPYFPDFTPDLTAEEEWTEVPVGDVRGFVQRPPPGVSDSTALRITDSMTSALRATYYDRSKFGYLRLGSNFFLSLGALGTGDTGLGWVGMSAAPTDPPRTTDEYTGTELLAFFHAYPPSQIGTAVTGPGQLAFIIGMTPGYHVYYKLVVTYVEAGHHVIGTCWRCTAGGDQIQVGGGEIGGWTDDPIEEINGAVLLEMSVVPLDPSQVEADGTPLPDGTMYFSLRIVGGLGFRDVLFTDLPPDPGASPLGGDAGYLIPAGVTVDDMLKEVHVGGRRLFLPFAPGDVIDLTGSGWPLAFTPVSLAPPKIPTSLSAGPSSGGPLRGKRNLGGTGLRKLSSQERYTIANLVYLAVSVGVVGENAAIAGAIGMAESGGDPQNIGYNPGPPASRDRGLWQINDYYHPDVSDQCAFDPTCNAHAMYTISSGGTNWTPWATYNNGLHLPFMAAAEAALSAMTDATPVAESATSGASGVASAGPRRHDGS
jgi:hypothetical protein